MKYNFVVYYRPSKTGAFDRLDYDKNSTYLSYIRRKGNQYQSRFEIVDIQRQTIYIV